jgi:hypothetical protein
MQSNEPPYMTDAMARLHIEKAAAVHIVSFLDEGEGAAYAYSPIFDGGVQELHPDQARRIIEKLKYFSHSSKVMNWAMCMSIRFKPP